MIVETFGTHRFAFGLSWVGRGDALDESLQDALTDGRVLSEVILYVTRQEKAKRGTADVGTVGFYVAGEKVSKPPASAAQAVAQRREDGLYVLPLADDSVWYCGVRAGVVVEGMDVVADMQAGVARVSELSETLDLPIFAPPGVEIGLPAFSPFDAADYLAHAVAPAMALYRGGGIPKIAFLLGLLVLVAGGTFFLVTHDSNKTPQMSPEQQHQMAVENYVRGTTSAIGAFPVGNAWAVPAYSKAIRTLPVYLSGWQLKEVSCLPQACSGTYALPSGGAYSITLFKQRFSGATLSPDGTTMTVSLPLSTETEVVNEGWFHRVPAESMPIGDWLGRVPLAMPGARVQSKPLTLKLGEKYSAGNAGLPLIDMEQVEVQGDQLLTPGRMVGLAEAGAAGGFRLLGFKWTPGIGGDTARWSEVWGRIHSQGN